LCGAVKTGFREADQRIDAGLQQLRRLAHGDIGRRRRSELGCSPAQARDDAGREAIAIFEELAAADPSSFEWPRYLIGAHAQIIKAGDQPGAVAQEGKHQVRISTIRIRYIMEYI
jgi:alkylation response protein AidB-like acyl-CoA dehydrogenase